MKLDLLILDIKFLNILCILEVPHEKNIDQ